MLRIIFTLALVVLLTGCSIGRQNETYDTSGALLSRNYESWQLGTTRQATMNASQQDGESIYELNIGESVQTDPEFAKIAQDAFLLGRLLGVGAAGGIPVGGLRAFNADGSATLDAPALTKEEQAAIYAQMVRESLQPPAEEGIE